MAILALGHVNALSADQPQGVTPAPTFKTVSDSGFKLLYGFQIHENPTKALNDSLRLKEFLWKNW